MMLYSSTAVGNFVTFVRNQEQQPEMKEHATAANAASAQLFSASSQQRGYDHDNGDATMMMMED